MGADKAWGSALALALALALGAGRAEAQGGGIPGRPAQEDLVNFGALGAAGAEDGAALRVQRVLDGPGQAAGLAPGDVITGAGGRAFQAAGGEAPGPRLQLVAALEQAEGARRPRPLELQVTRGGESRTIAVRLGKLGAHSKACPTQCKKCKAVARAGLEFLARTQAGDGSFPTDLGGQTGLVVVTSLGGLAFLAQGVKPTANSPLGRAIEYVRTRCNTPDPMAGRMGGVGGGRGNWNQVNWELAYGLIFLAEAARATRRADLEAKCAELVQALQRTQEASGGWAHGPGGPNALGYLELEILSNYALLGLGAAQKLGIEFDGDKVARALGWIEQTAGPDGGVGYSPRQGQKGFGDPGRTAGALVAYAAVGQARHPFFGKMVGYFGQHAARLPEGHVSPAQHLLAGAMASRLLGNKAWGSYWQAFRPLVMSLRRPDGSFASMPTAESRRMGSNSDLTCGPRWTTATYVLVLSLTGSDALPLLLDGEVEKGRSRPRTGGR